MRETQIVVSSFKNFQQFPPLNSLRGQRAGYVRTPGVQKHTAHSCHGFKAQQRHGPGRETLSTVTPEQAPRLTINQTCGTPAELTSYHVFDNTQLLASYY